MSETFAATCPYCGASNLAQKKICWLCQKDLPTATSADAGTIHPSKNLSTQFTIAGVLLLTTVVAVCFAVLAMVPGLGILLAILSVPAFVRTGMVVQRRSQLGKPVSASREVFWFLGSITVTTIIVAVVVVASIGTFCAVCLSAGTDSAIPFAALVAGAVTIGVVIVVARWIRARWRRDVKAD